MPLLYGEGVGAFRRLQETILARGEDYSLFAWSRSWIKESMVTASSSILAPAPRAFQGCNDIRKGFATQRILFEVTSRGMMVLIHRSYHPDTTQRLLHYASTQNGPNEYPSVGLTIPLGCFISPKTHGICEICHKTQGCFCQSNQAFFLRLVLDGGIWRRLGVTSHADEPLRVHSQGKYLPAYTNDYIRIYVHHEKQPSDGASPTGSVRAWQLDPNITWLHMKNSIDYRLETC